MAGHDLTHCASALCSAPAAAAFAYLADPGCLGEWALGCWGATPERGGLVRGTSLFDGSVSFVRARADRDRLLVDYDVGGEPTALDHRISARAVPGPSLGRSVAECLVILLAWRHHAMGDERWHRLRAAHDAEVLLLRHRIEASR